ncbi:MAG: TonB-dependent receptor [Ruminococcus sp.]|nr:TonB-dependent receptor [Ruminococcus sp.]
MMKNRIINRIGAGLLAMSCAFSMLGTTIPIISASAAMTTENTAFPSSDEVIAQAATLLGSPYGWGFKGYTGVYYQDSYSPLSLDYVRQQGVDCSGLLYYTLTHLGYSTSGFSWNNPVPVDTPHWLSVNDNCTITYNGVTSKIDVEKENIPYKERPYWECADGSTITPGSVVIADNLNGEDHSWIYIGEFNNRDEVIAYLKKIGVNESYINSNTVGDGSGDGGTHWRIESNGSQGCVINNRTDGKQATALNMFAFRVAERDVIFEIDKYNKDGNLVGKSAVDNSSAVYGIYSDKECTKSVGTITIGTDGRGAISLPNGTYYAKETKAPTGYELDPTVYTISPGMTKVTEDYKFGSIKINKTAEDGIVSDREFKVTWTENGKSQSKTAKTNDSGVADFKNLKVYDMSSGQAISYNVSEINVDTKYVTPKAYDITLTDGNADLSVDVMFENKLKKFTAEVVKKDVESVTAQGDATLAGATYGLYHDGNRVATYTTDENGHFVTDEFVCGNYTLQELTPSQGYQLNDEIYKVGAEPQNYKVEVNPIALDVTEDVVKGHISLIKHSDDGTTGIDTPEDRAEFEVYLKSAGSYDNAKETERDYLTTDENGFAETKELPYGTYTVHQTTGWKNTEYVDDFDVIVDENGKDYQYILNDAVITANIRIVKKDAETGNVIPVSGIGFQIWSVDDEKYISQTINYPEETTLDTFYTNETGSLMLPNELVYGNYELHEVKAPTGYFLNSEPVPFTVDGTEKTIEVEKYDTAQKGRISVSKRGEIFKTVQAIGPAIHTNEDGETETSGFTTYTPVFEESGLGGAEFEVIAAEDIYTADGTLRASAGEVVADIITDKEGNASTEPLYLGKYVVKEKTAPCGYVQNDEAKEVELTYAGQEVSITDAVNNTFNNDYQRVKISLAKFMEHDELFDIGENDEYKKVTFGLYAAEDITAADGTVIPEDGFIAQVSLGEDMTADFTEKLPFSRYYVQEIATDEHYMLNGEKYLVNFQYMGQEMSTVNIDCGTFINDIKRGLVSGKKVNENGDPLENALFGLFSADETEFTAENAYLTDESDEDGNFGFTDIPYGEYIVKEIAAPTGYILSDEQYPVVIAEDGDVVEITAENKAITVSISKEDLYGNELTGASMQLIDENGEIVDEWISDGENHIITNISAGGYTLKEVAAPDGYVIATDISFTIDEYGNVTVDGVEANAFDDDGNPIVTMIDDATLVKISKQDMTTGTELAGATLQVIDKDGNIVEEWVSTNEPHYIEAKLIAGETYTLREITAPDGYNTAEDIEFTVNADGRVTEVTMKDEAVIVTTPNVATGDTGKSPLGYIMMIAGLVLLTVSIFARKKKEEPADDYAELCPDFIEGEED